MDLPTLERAAAVASARVGALEATVRMPNRQAVVTVVLPRGSGEVRITRAVGSPKRATGRVELGTRWGCWHVAEDMVRFASALVDMLGRPA